MFVRVHRAQRTTSGVLPWVKTLLVVAVLAVSIVGISGPVAAQDTVFRFGGNVVVAEGERTFGDVIAFGGAVEIFGEVTGDVVALGGTVTIDGTVTGDVVALGGAVTLGADATVGGDVTAVGGSVDRSPDADVRGEIVVANLAQGFRFGFGAPAFSAWQWFGFPFSLLYVAGLFALALVVLAVMPNNVHAVENHMESNAGRSIVIGLLATVLLIPLTVVLILTIVGPPLLWLAFLAAKMVGYVALVGIVGRKVVQRFGDDAAPIWQVVVGVAIVAVLRYVPVLGIAFTAVATMWSLGAVLDTKFGTNRPWLPPRQKT